MVGITDYSSVVAQVGSKHWVGNIIYCINFVVSSWRRLIPCFAAWLIFERVYWWEVEYFGVVVWEELCIVGCFSFPFS